MNSSIFTYEMNTHTTETMAAFNRTTPSSQVMLEIHLCGYRISTFLSASFMWVYMHICVCVKPWLCSLYTYVLLHVSMMQECMLAACDISLTRYLPITIV